MQRPQAQQNNGNEAKEALKLNLLVIHRQTLYTFLYMLTQQISVKHDISCSFSIKTHTDVHYKKVFLFAKEHCLSSVGVYPLMHNDAATRTLFTDTTA